MSFTADLPSTEDILKTVFSSSIPPLPPSEQEIGGSAVSWWETTPGEVYVHAEGGTTGDRHYGAVMVRLQLEGHGYRHAQFDFDRDDEHLASRRISSWPEVMAKAKRLIQSGQVHVLRNGFNYVVGHVQGDHGDYDCEISRDDPNSRSITSWQCSCPWDQFAWQRTRKWKKFEGRPCAHVLALQWMGRQLPLDEQLTPEQAEAMGTGQKLPAPAVSEHPPEIEDRILKGEKPGKEPALPRSFSPEGEIIPGDQQHMFGPERPEAVGGPAQSPLAPPPQGPKPGGPQPPGVLPPFPGEQMQMPWQGPGTTPGGGVSPPGAYTVPGAKPPNQPANPVQNPGTYSKVASGLYYHVAPATHAPSIEQNGLDPWAERRVNIPGQPQGLYLWDDLGAAQRYARQQFHDQPIGSMGAQIAGEPYHIWEVRPEDDEIWPDPYEHPDVPEYQHSFYTREPIPPEQLRRLGKTASAAPEPPDYRKADSKDTCGTCKMFDKGLCWGYGNYEVERDHVCDSFAPEGKTSSYQTSDPTVCPHCQGRMTEPQPLGSGWASRCTECGLSRDVNPRSPIVQNWQQEQDLGGEYPPELQELWREKQRPWAFARTADFQPPQVIRLKDTDKPPMGIAQGPEAGRYGDGEYREVPVYNPNGRPNYGEVRDFDPGTGFVKAIFPLHGSGYHEPYHVEVYLDANEIDPAPSSVTNAFIRRRH